MGKHMVKCPICGEQFDRDKEEAVIYNKRRYAHLRCVDNSDGRYQLCTLDTHPEKLPSTAKEKEELYAYIRQLFNLPRIPRHIANQTKRYVEELGFTYSGILKTLIYWYEKRGGDVEKARGGIGIVEYVYKDAMQYYYNLWLAHQANATVNVEQYTLNERAVTIPSPRISVNQHKMFNIEEGMDEE